MLTTKTTDSREKKLPAAGIEPLTFCSLRQPVWPLRPKVTTTWDCFSSELDHRACQGPRIFDAATRPEDSQIRRRRRRRFRRDGVNPDALRRDSVLVSVCASLPTCAHLDFETWLASYLTKRSWSKLAWWNFMLYFQRSIVNNRDSLHTELFIGAYFWSVIGLCLNLTLKFFIFNQHSWNCFISELTCDFPGTFTSGPT